MLDVKVLRQAEGWEAASLRDELRAAAGRRRRRRQKNPRPVHKLAAAPALLLPCLTPRSLWATGQATGAQEPGRARKPARRGVVRTLAQAIQA